MIVGLTDKFYSQRIEVKMAKYSRRIKKFGGKHQTMPIKDPKQIDNLLFYLLSQCEKAKSPIKKYQADRNYMFILIGINTAFRAEDLLQLRVADVEKGYFSIKENKTGKMQNFRMNKQLHQQILEYIDKYKLTHSDYMFRGQIRTINKVKYIYPITRQQGYRILSKCAIECGIDIVFGMHSLRKTFGYQYILNGGKFVTLMKMYNHSDPAVTMRYVLWDSTDVEQERENIYIGNSVSKKRSKIAK